MKRGVWITFAGLGWAALCLLCACDVSIPSGSIGDGPGSRTFCGGGGNQCPVVEVGSNARNAPPGSLVTLDATASSDPDGDAVFCNWRQVSGPRSLEIEAEPGNGCLASVMPTEDGAYQFTVIVTDGHGGSADATIELVVTQNPEEDAPWADAGEDRTVDEGRSVTLRGGNSADPNGDPLDFAWIQLAGPEVSLAGRFTAEPSFTAPFVDQDTELVFRLTVDDEFYYSSDEVTITVQDLDYQDNVNDNENQNANENDNSAEPECETDAGCDDGELCTGDACVDGFCEYEPVECPEGQECNPATGECELPCACETNDDCDDGVFCNGAENCDEDCQCQPGTDPCAEDESCNEEADTCAAAPECTTDADCDDGLFCDGTEVCVDGACQAGTPPCDPVQLAEGFENPDTIFSHSSTHSISYDIQNSEAAHTGAYSFKSYTSTCGGSCHDEYRVDLLHTFPEPVRLIGVEFWAREDSTTGRAWGGKISVGHDSTWNLWWWQVVNNDDPITGEWQHVFVPIDETAADVRIRIMDITSISTMWVDDIVIHYEQACAPCGPHIPSRCRTVLLVEDFEECDVGTWIGDCKGWQTWANGSNRSAFFVTDENHVSGTRALQVAGAGSCWEGSTYKPISSTNIFAKAMIRASGEGPVGCHHRQNGFLLFPVAAWGFEMPNGEYPGGLSCSANGGGSFVAIEGFDNAAGQWYEVAIELDYDNGLACFWLDDALVFSTEFNTDVTVEQIAMNSGEGRGWFDDVVVCEVSPGACEDAN